MSDRRWILAWSLATALPIGVIFAYTAYWSLVHPRATDADRAVFIVCCAVVCAMLVASRGLQNRRLRRERRAAGQCLRCGYDLRASRERCPECGLAFTSKPCDEARLDK